MAHTKAGGSTRLGRDSQSKRLGVKLYGGQTAQAGDIIVRQRGLRIIGGTGTLTGIDHTIHAAVAGTVVFSQRRQTNFTGTPQRRTIVSIQP